METILDQLKEHPSLGSYAAIARACGVSREAVRKWRKVPAEHCAAIAVTTGGEWPKWKLRPDIFDAPTDAGEARDAA